MRFTLRDWMYIALFGALWALVDARAGPELVARDVPFFSSVLAALGILLALVGRRLVPRAGVITLIAVFALALKFIYAGGFLSTPLLRILSPALAAELVLLLIRRPGLVAFTLAGSVAVLWMMAQSFLFPAIFAPQGLKMVYAITLIGGAKALQSTDLSPLVLLAAAGLLHLAGGGLAGLAAWSAGKIFTGRRITPGKAVLDATERWGPG